MTTALTAALEEYADPRNWDWTAEGWVFIDDAEPWGRAKDALEKEGDHGPSAAGEAE